MANNPRAKDNLKNFKKGKGENRDPRINTNGRPKSFDKLRKLAQQLAHEEAKGPGGQTIVIDNQKQTQITMLLRQMIKDNPVKFLEYAFGKPIDEIKHSGEVNIKGYTKVSPDDWE
jgi:hypothetical protein